MLVWSISSAHTRQPKQKYTYTHIHSMTHTTSSYHLELAHVICKRILCPDGAVESCPCHHPPDVATYPTECREGHLFITIIITASLLPESSQVNPPLSSAEHLPNMYTACSLLLCEDVCESHSTGSIHIKLKEKIKWSHNYETAGSDREGCISLSFYSLSPSLCMYSIVSFSVNILYIFLFSVIFLWSA